MNDSLMHLIVFIIITILCLIWYGHYNEAFKYKKLKEDNYIILLRKKELPFSHGYENDLKYLGMSESEFCDFCVRAIDFAIWEKRDDIIAQDPLTIVAINRKKDQDKKDFLDYYLGTVAGEKNFLEWKQQHTVDQEYSFRQWYEDNVGKFPDK